MPGGATFEFVLVAQRGQTTKERQLQQAFARSHAAKVSHSSRKRPKARPKKAQSCIPTAPGLPLITESEPDLCVATLPTPRSMIGDAWLDPFDGGGLRQIPSVGRKSLEYVYTVLWPKNYPAVSGLALQSMQTTWRWRAIEDPLQFHAQVFNATTMCYALSTDPSTMMTLMDIRLKHQTAAVNLVRKRLQTLKGPAPEQLIADIMRLAAQGGDTFRLSTSSRYPETPLANAFALKPYGRFDTSLPHFSALVQLVKQRGGLETLSVSVGHPIQLIDIGIAARLGTRPCFPIRGDFKSMCDIEAAKFDGEAVALLLTTGRGWQILQQDHPDIVKLALYAIRLTACLDQTQRRGPEHLSLKELGILATIFQHDLYELNPTLGAGDLTRDPLSNIARLALQIYSDLVLFPAAETYHAKDRLCRELLATLRQYFSDGAPQFDELKVLILWAVVLGAIASDSTYNRDWYLRRMIGLVIQLDLDWDTFKACMEQFIWWDYMFDDRVSNAWAEAWRLTGRAQSTASGESPELPNWKQVVGGKAKWFPVMLTEETGWVHHS